MTRMLTQETGQEKVSILANFLNESHMRWAERTLMLIRRH
jgi:hypothetical protein